MEMTNPETITVDFGAPTGGTADGGGQDLKHR